MTPSSVKRMFSFLVGGALAASVFLFSPFALAENPPSPCNLNAKLDYLSQIKDDVSLTAQKKSELDFAGRKDLLSAIINCSKEESREVKSKLPKPSSLSNETDGRTAAAYANLLDSFVGYYEQQETAFSSASTSPEKIKDLAQEILSWRQSHYNDPVEQIVDFTLALKQQDGISLAANRLKKIRSSLTSLLSIRNPEIDGLILSAGQNISRSRELNEQALSTLRSSFLASPAAAIATTTSAFSPVSTSTPLYFISILPPATTTPDASLETTSTASSPTPTESIGGTPTGSVGVRDLIKESYEKLKIAYENFFQLSKSVRKILGF